MIKEITVINDIKKIFYNEDYDIVGYIENHNRLLPNINIVFEKNKKDKIIEILKNKNIEYKNINKYNILKFNIKKVDIILHFVENPNWVKFIKGKKKYDENNNLNKIKELVFFSIVNSFPIKIIDYYDEYYNINKYLKYELFPYEGIYEITYSYVDKDNKLKKYESEINRNLKTNSIKEFKKMFLGENFVDYKINTLNDLIDIIENKDFILFERKSIIYINVYKELVKKNLINKINKKLKKHIYANAGKCNFKIL